MPYVDGRRVAAAVKEAAPTMPVILLTGWGQRLMSDDDFPPNIDRVLTKPPKLRELQADAGGAVQAGRAAVVARTAVSSHSVMVVPCGGRMRRLSERQ